MLKSVEIRVSEKMVCIYCGQTFEGVADLCLCLTKVVQEALTSANAFKQQREFEAAERLEMDR